MFHLRRVCVWVSACCILSRNWEKIFIVEYFSSSICVCVTFARTNHLMRSNWIRYSLKAKCICWSLFHFQEAISISEMKIVPLWISIRSMTLQKICRALLSYTWSWSKHESIQCMLLVRLVRWNHTFDDDYYCGCGFGCGTVQINKQINRSHFVTVCRRAIIFLFFKNVCFVCVIVSYCTDRTSSY